MPRSVFLLVRAGGIGSTLAADDPEGREPPIDVRESDGAVSTTGGGSGRLRPGGRDIAAFEIRCPSESRAKAVRLLSPASGSAG